MKQFLILGIIALSVVACQKFSPPKDVTAISKHGEDESHEKGNNCMNCHTSAGYGEGFFSLAGSMYGNTSNADVLVYEEFGLDPILIIQIDQLGNAYTTEQLDFSNGLHVGVRNADGEIELMEDRLYSGQCNLCHGTGISDNIEIE